MSIESEIFSAPTGLVTDDDSTESGSAILGDKKYPITLLRGRFFLKQVVNIITRISQPQSY